MKTKPALNLHTLSWIKTDRRCNIDRLFTYTMGNTNGSTSATTLVYNTIGYWHTAVKEEARLGGITWLSEVTLMKGYLMEIYVSVY